MQESSSSLPAPVAIAIGVVFAIVVVFVIVNYFKKRAAAWEGKVIDKDIRYREPSNVGSRNTSEGVTISTGQIQPIPEHYLIVETSSGEKVTLKVSDGIYEEFKVGDPIAKDSGTMIPHKPASK